MWKLFWTFHFFFFALSVHIVLLIKQLQRLLRWNVFLSNFDFNTLKMSWQISSKKVKFLPVLRIILKRRRKKLSRGWRKCLMTFEKYILERVEWGKNLRIFPSGIFWAFPRKYRKRFFQRATTMCMSASGKPYLQLSSSQFCRSTDEILRLQDTLAQALMIISEDYTARIQLENWQRAEEK